MFTEVAPGIFSVDSRFVEGKYGIIIGRRGALAVDVGLHTDEGQAMADFLRDRGCRPDRVVLTHGHQDHIFGGAAFQGAEVFAHELTPALIRDNLARFAGIMHESIAQLEERALWPTVLFSGDLLFDLGGLHARLFPTPGHTPDSVSVLVEEGAVLFTGDAAVTGIIPAVEFYDAALMEATLRRMAALGAAVLISGHGPVIHGRAEVRAWLTWLADYLAGVRRKVVLGLDRGLRGDALVESVDYVSHVGDHLPPDRFNQVLRHRNAVAKIVQEEMERRTGKRQPLSLLDVG